MEDWASSSVSLLGQNVSSSTTRDMKVEDGPHKENGHADSEHMREKGSDSLKDE